MIKINKAGYIYILLTILIGFSAVNTGNNLLYIITSTLLGYMLISGVFGRRNIHQVTVSLHFPQECFAQTPVPVGVSVSNGSRFIPAFLIKITVENQQVLFPIIDAKSSTTEYLHMTFPKRGRYKVEDALVSSVFPFNFFNRFRRISINMELLIFPKLVKCSLERRSTERVPIKGERSSDSPGYDSDILSIRDYVEGDAIKYISWKATAKTGHLKTKEMATLQSPKIIIDLNKMKKLYDLETAISCAAYLVVKLIRSGNPVGILIESDVYKPDISYPHRIRILSVLALL